MESEHTQDGFYHTCILVKEAPADCTFSMTDEVKLERDRGQGGNKSEFACESKSANQLAQPVDTCQNDAQASERIIQPVSTRALPKLEDFLQNLDAKTKPRHSGGKTTAKKERRKLKARFSTFLMMKNKIAPMPVKQCVAKTDVTSDKKRTESVTSVPEDITSPKTLYTRCSDLSVKHDDIVSVVGVDATYQHIHRREFLFNLFGECFGFLRLNKVERDENMYLCGTKATIEEPEVEELKSLDSENSITTVKRSVPYINLHDTRASPLRQLGSNSTISLINSDQPKSGQSSQELQKTKKPKMSKKDTKLFWERIKKMELIKKSNKLPPLKKGTRYFEVQNDASRPCTPKPQIASCSTRKSSKTVDIASKLLEANERRDAALRAKTEAAGRSNRPRGNIVQLRMNQNQEAMRQKILERERRLQEQKALEKSERERKKQEEETRRQEKLREVENQKRAKVENKKLRMLEKEAQNSGRRTAMMASRSEKKRQTEARREQIKIEKETQEKARVEKFQQKQQERESMADGRRSSMLASRQEKLRKHHNRVNVIQKKFTRPAHIRAIDIPIEPTEYPVEWGIEGGPRPTSPDEYRWSPTPPPPPTPPPLIIDTDDEEEYRNPIATPQPVLIDGEDPTDFFLKDMCNGEREPGDGEQEKDAREDGDGEVAKSPSQGDSSCVQEGTVQISVHDEVIFDGNKDDGKPEHDPKIRSVEGAKLDGADETYIIGAVGAKPVIADGAIIINKGAYVVGADGAKPVLADGAIIINNGAYVVGADGAKPVPADGATVIDNGAYVVGADGAKPVLADGATVIDNGAYVVGADGAKPVLADGATVIDNGAYVFRADGANPVFADGATTLDNGAYVVGADGAKPVLADGATTLDNGAYVVGADGANPVFADGATIINKGAYVVGVDGAKPVLADGVTVIDNGAYVVRADGANPVFTDGATIINNGAYVVGVDGANPVFADRAKAIHDGEYVVGGEEGHIPCADVTKAVCVDGNEAMFANEAKNAVAQGAKVAFGNGAKPVYAVNGDMQGDIERKRQPGVGGEGGGEAQN